MHKTQNVNNSQPLGLQYVTKKLLRLEVTLNHQFIVGEVTQFNKAPL